MDQPVSWHDDDIVEVDTNDESLSRYGFSVVDPPFCIENPTPTSKVSDSSGLIFRYSCQRRDRRSIKQNKRKPLV